MYIILIAKHLFLATLQSQKNNRELYNHAILDDIRVWFEGVGGVWIDIYIIHVSLDYRLC